MFSLIKLNLKSEIWNLQFTFSFKSRPQLVPLEYDSMLRAKGLTTDISHVYRHIRRSYSIIREKLTRYDLGWLVPIRQHIYWLPWTPCSPCSRHWTKSTVSSSGTRLTECVFNPDRCALGVLDKITNIGNDRCRRAAEWPRLFKSNRPFLEVGTRMWNLARPRSHLLPPLSYEYAIRVAPIVGICRRKLEKAWQTER